ncbi:MAG: TrkH family potassium uptake protein [Clostridia bacterium]|nr:TrkH family potassium uptake protein [Clostridia bacterium]
MNVRMLGYLFGIVMTIEAALLLLPLATAAVYGESLLPFLYTMALLLGLAIPLILLRPRDRRFFAREGFLCAAGTWILLSLFGALPFLFSGAIPHYVDAVFETVSGFTTTGASILRRIEGLPRGILLWRSLTHWVGGMGVLVFMLAILPADNSRAMYLLRAEVPGPTKGKIVPRLRESAKILYGIYLALTVLELLALLIAGLPFYDALVNSLATAGTGGFSVLNSSIAGYGSPAVEWVIAVFMFLFGINFNLYFFLLLGRVRDIWKSEEFRAYLVITVGATLVILFNTLSLYRGFGEALRTAFFQVTSVMSTTGFATVDFNAVFPTLSKTVLIALMIIGASAGSTAGGLKISRVIILVKNAFREVKHILRPRSVNVTRLDSEALPEETVRATSNYLTLYFGIFLLSALLISVDGHTVETTLTASLTCLNNVGPGLGAVGPAGSFADFSVFSKIVLSLEMLIGRLEIIPLLIFFSPSTWRRA